MVDLWRVLIILLRFIIYNIYFCFSAGHKTHNAKTLDQKVGTRHCLASLRLLHVGILMPAEQVRFFMLLFLIMMKNYWKLGASVGCKPLITRLECRILCSLFFLLFLPGMIWMDFLSCVLLIFHQEMMLMHLAKPWKPYTCQFLRLVWE